MTTSEVTKNTNCNDWCDLSDFIYVSISGKKVKKYKTKCSICLKDRGYQARCGCKKSTCKACIIEQKTLNYNKNPKYCIVCNTVLPFFIKRKSQWCRKCSHKSSINPTVKIEQALYREKNKEKRKLDKKEWYLKNKEHKLFRDKENIKKNITAHRNRQLRCKKKLEQTNPLVALKNNIRKAVYSILRRNGYNKKSNTYQLLCCSYEEFLIHLGPKPEGDYHLDHICPCAQAQNEEELIKLQHYTNFRWLLARDNILKSNNRVPEAEEMCKKLLGRDWQNE